MQADKINNTIYFTSGEAEGLSCSVADINCWLYGFVAAGGDIDPISLSSLRELNRTLKELKWRTED